MFKVPAPPKPIEEKIENTDRKLIKEQQQSSADPFSNPLDNTLNNENNNPFDFLSNTNPANDFNNANPFDDANQNFMMNNSAFFGNGGVTDSVFKPGEECLNELERDEQLNRKEFADNELSVMMNYDKSQNNGNASSCGSGGGNGSSGNSSTNEKWWANATNIQQSSKLELSNVSYLSSTLPQQQNAEINQNKESNNKIPVNLYFDKGSDLPNWLVQARSDVNLSLSNSSGKSEDKKSSKQNNSDKLASSSDDDNNITFSNSLNGQNSISSSNFSFTFNASDTGDFIQKKSAVRTPKIVVQNSTPSPKEVAKLSTNETKKILNKSSNSSISTNLKTIGEELDKFSNRLASTSTIKQAISEPLMSSSTLQKPANNSSSIKTDGLKVGHNNVLMDETVSSISSALTSDIVHKNKKKIVTSASQNQKPASESTSKNTAAKSSSSLTSTPSKLVKSVSEHSNLSSNNNNSKNIMDKLYKNSSSSINQTSENASSNNPHLFSQDSFISSIPEKTTNADEELEQLHRHHLHSHHHYYNKHKSNRHKNVNVQTTPDKKQSNDASAPPEELHVHNQNHNRVSIASTTSTSTLTSSTSSNDLTTASALSKLSSIMNTNLNPNNNGDLVPIAFLPMNVVFPCMQKIINENNQSNNINKSNNVSQNDQINNISTSLMLNSKLFSEHNQNSASPSSFISNNSNSSISTISSLSKFAMNSNFELPQIELNRSSIDFGHVAEGCSTSMRLMAKILNSQRVLSNNGFVQYEIEDINDWLIEPFNQTSEDDSDLKKQMSYLKNNFVIMKKVNQSVLRSKLKKSLQLLQNENSSSVNSMIRFDLFSNYCSFLINLNLKDLNLYKYILEQFNDSASTVKDQPEPLRIKANLNIYFFMPDCSTSANNTNNNNMRKFLLSSVSICFVLGYSKLKTSANMNCIEFEVTELDDDDQINDHSSNNLTLACGEDANADKTLTQCHAESSQKSDFTEKLVPISNSGNINVDVNCYFSQNSDLKDNNSLEPIKFKNYELKIDELVLTLEAKSKHKSIIRLIFKKFLSQSTEKNSNSDDQNIKDLEKLKLIIQVIPSGFKFEIPIRFKFVNKPSRILKPPQISILNTIEEKNKSKSVKLLSSRSVLFFGKSLTSQNQDEFTIMNPNDFQIKCQILIKNDSSSNQSFQLSSEMNTTAQSPYQMIITLEPKKDFRLKLKFNSDLSSDSLIRIGKVKMTVIGFSNRFIVNMIGFTSQITLEIENSIKTSCLTGDPNHMTQLEEQFDSKSIKYSKYSIELASQSQTSNNLGINLLEKKSIYRKIVKLNNKTFSTSYNITNCILIPIVYDLKNSKEIQVSRMLSTNGLAYNLDPNIPNNLKITINNSMNTKLNSSENSIFWLDLKSNDASSLNLEYTLINNQFGTSDNLCLGLFWIEYDIFAYFYQLVQFNQSKLASLPSNPANTSVLDLLFEKLILAKQFFGPEATSGLNETLFNKLKRMSISSDSSLSSLASSCDVDQSSNGHKSSYLKMTRDDLFRLFKQSMKCSLIKLAIEPVSSYSFSRNFDDDSLEVRSSPVRREHVIDMALTNNMLLKNSEWSVSPNSILIENIKNEKLIENYFAKFYIRNNSTQQKLDFNLKYQNIYLKCEPYSGHIEPMSKCEIVVKPRREAFQNLPWKGSINIMCNDSQLLQKDIQVSLFSSISNMSELDVNKKLAESSCTSVISDISQYSIDSLSLTPLINASFSTFSLANPSLSSTQHQSLSTSSSNNNSSVSNNMLSRSNLSQLNQIKVVRSGKDVQIKFPPVCITQKKSIELTLTNPTTNSFVYWKVHSRIPALVRLQENNSLVKSTYSTFIITPSSGIINVGQEQTIKVEFAPREVHGLFTQFWDIDTETEKSSQNEAKTDSFNCRMILSGRSIELPQEENDSLTRLTERILKSNNNNKNVSQDNQEKNKYLNFNNQTKQNKEQSDRSLYLNNQNSSSTTSLLSLSALSSTSSSSLQLIAPHGHCRVEIKDEIIKFPDTSANQTSKTHLTVHNRENFACKLTILNVMEPFYCKHTQVDINPKHFIRIPFEFRPKVATEFVDKILIKIDRYDSTLSCLIKGKCVSN
jgi:hypothetical protein